MHHIFNYHFLRNESNFYCEASFYLTRKYQPSKFNQFLYFIIKWKVWILVITFYNLKQLMIYTKTHTHLSKKKKKKSNGLLSLRMITYIYLTSYSFLYFFIILTITNNFLLFSYIFCSIRCYPCHAYGFF